MPVITISRQFGAGGKTLADQLATRLGYDVATEDIIEKLAQSTQLSNDSIRSFEGEENGKLRSPSPAGFIRRILDKPRNIMDEQQYARLLHQIIPRIADGDNVIILGRGAQFILKDRKNVVHILLLAAEADRISFMQEHYDLAPDDARQAVIKKGKRRLKLMRLFDSADYDQPVHYDLVLNMSKLSLERALDLICALVAP
ncbi:MAG: cytidylate kinase-like family protein [Desulfobacterales bacterium]